jgi:hypothetical protein
LTYSAAEPPHARSTILITLQGLTVEPLTCRYKLTQWPGAGGSPGRRVATVERMTIQRMEHVGIVVDDLVAARAAHAEPQL